LEDTLVEKNKHDLLGAVQGISNLAKFSYVRQSMPLGDGHALLQAAHLLGGEPVLVMFGDCLYDSNVPTSRQLIDEFEQRGRPIIGLSEVPEKEVKKFGVVDGQEIEKGVYKISRLVEKPDPDKAPSNLVAVGKYIITPDIFDTLKLMKNGKSGEIRLADALEIFLENGKPLYGKELEGEWLDTGDKVGFLKATVKMALKHEELNGDFRKFLEEVIRK